MRILILQPGIGSYRVDFFNQLAAQAELKVVYYLEDSSGQVFLDSVTDRLQNCHLEKMSGGLMLGESPINFQLFQIIRQWQPDVVVSHEYRPMTLLLAWYRRLLHPRWKLFIWSSDSAEMVINCRPLRRIARDFLCRMADGVMVYSADVAGLYAEKVKIPADKLVVCTNVQSSARLRREAAAAMELSEQYRRKYQLQGKKVFLFVGRLSAVKNLPCLFRAFKMADLPDAVLAAVGSGELEEELKTLINDLGMAERIILPGRAENLALSAWYQAADVLTLVSFSETFGAVVNEALAVGLPVILTERAGAKVLLNEATQGELVNPADEAQITAAIRRQYAQIKPHGNALRPDLMPWDLPQFVNGFLNFAEEKCRK